MSENTKNNGEASITATPDGKFTVNTFAGKSYNASVRHDGGADIVQFTDPDQEAQAREVSRGGTSKFLQAAEGTVQIDSDGSTKVLGVSNHTIPPKPGGLGNLLNTVTDLAGRPALSLEDVKKNPAGYKASIMGTEASVESLLRSGILTLDSTGAFQEDIKRQMSFVNPRDPSNSYNDIPRRDPNFAPQDSAVILLTSVLEQAGVDPEAIFAKALADSDTAAKELNAALQLDDEYEAASLLSGTIQAGVAMAVKVLEKHFVEPGKGQEVIDNLFDGGIPRDIAARLIHGMMKGSKGAYQEAVHRLLSGDKF